jgi:hypothetical protein
MVPATMRSPACASCGGEVVATRGEHRYDECGISGVVLVDVAIASCRSCGAREVSIPSSQELVERIVQLAGAEDIRLTFVAGHWRAMRSCILVAIESPSRRLWVIKQLAAAGDSAIAIADERELEATLQQATCAAAVVDGDARDLIRALRQRSPATLIVALGGGDARDSVVAARLAGNVRLQKIVDAVQTLVRRHGGGR